MNLFERFKNMSMEEVEQMSAEDLLKIREECAEKLENDLFAHEKMVSGILKVSGFDVIVAPDKMGFVIIANSGSKHIHNGLVSEAYAPCFNFKIEVEMLADFRKNEDFALNAEVSVAHLRLIIAKAILFHLDSAIRARKLFIDQKM